MLEEGRNSRSIGGLGKGTGVKLEANNVSHQRRLKAQIEKARSGNDFVRREETLGIPEICEEIGLISGYDDVRARVSSRVIKRPVNEPIVVCSDASVIHEINGVAGIGFIAYTAKSHNLVGYGHAMLTHALGKPFSSHGAETLGMAISAFSMRGFAGTITCDNEQSVAAFNRACRHTQMEEIAQWEKGHADSLGNIYADNTAKKALANIKDLAPSLGQKRLIGDGRYTCVPKIWIDRVNVDARMRRQVNVTSTSRIIRGEGGVKPTALRTALVQAPCLEGAQRHLFMIVGTHDNKVVSVETGSISSDSEHPGWSENIPAIFMKNIMKRYANPLYSKVRQVTVSPYIRRYHDAGIRDIEREISNGTYNAEMNFNPHIDLANVMDEMRSNRIRFSIEKSLRSASIEQWEDHIRNGSAPFDKLENFLAETPLRPRWKLFPEEAVQMQPQYDMPLVDLSEAPQPEMPHAFPVSSKSAYKMNY